MMMLPLVQLATHPGLQVHPHPEREPCMYMYIPNTPGTLEAVSLPAAGHSSCSRLRGTQRGRLYSWCKFGHRAGSVARAPGVQSRASWQVITGSLSAEPEPSRSIENPQTVCCSFCSPPLLSLKYHSSPQKAT